MKKELQDKIINDFPELFSNSFYEIETKDGWYNIIYDLCKEIKNYCEGNDLSFPNIIKIKQNFASIRFYINYNVKEIKHMDNIYKLINNTEQISEKTCENCGKSGKIRNYNGYYHVKCDKCNNE